MLRSPTDGTRARALAMEEGSEVGCSSEDSCPLVHLVRSCVCVLQQDGTNGSTPVMTKPTSR